MTTEQIIVIGFIVAAFLAGWIASLVTRRRARSAGRPAAASHTVEAVTAPAQAQAAAAGETPPWPRRLARRCAAMPPTTA